MADRKVGGPVPGAHGQMVPINAHGGEYVLSADVVDAIKNGRPSAGLPALASTAGRPSVSGGGGPVSYRQDIQLVVRDPHEAMTELRAAHRMQQLSHS